MLDAAVAAGAPRASSPGSTCPAWSMTNEVMSSADIIPYRRPWHGQGGAIPLVSPPWASARATPRPSSTTPADITLAVNSIIHSKTFDNGMICASEQSIIVLDKVYDKVRKEFAAGAATS